MLPSQNLSRKAVVWLSLLITHEIVFGLEALAKRSDLPLIVEYSISPEWGKRFGLWSGTVKTSPFTATVRK